MKNNLYLADFVFGSRMHKRSNDQHGINLIGCWEYITQFILFQLLVGNSSAVDFSCSLVKLVMELEGLPPPLDDLSLLLLFRFNWVIFNSLRKLSPSFTLWEGDHNYNWFNLKNDSLRIHYYLTKHFQLTSNY